MRRLPLLFKPIIIQNVRIQNVMRISAGMIDEGSYVIDNKHSFLVQHTCHMWIVGAEIKFKSGSCMRAVWWKNKDIFNVFDFDCKKEQNFEMQPCCHLNWIRTIIYQNIYWFIVRSYKL